jgi:hypothetical protein
MPLVLIDHGVDWFWLMRVFDLFYDKYNSPHMYTPFQILESKGREKAIATLSEGWISLNDV